MIEASETTTKSESSQTKGRIIDEVRERGEVFSNKAKAKASTFGGQAKEQGAKLAASGKSRTASKVRDFKASTEGAAAELDLKGSRVAAAATRAVAGAAGDVAGYLDEKPVKEIWDDANSFTRKHPAIVFGGLLLAGLAVGRVIRASSEGSPNSSASDTPRDFPDVTPHYVGSAGTKS